MDSGESVRRGTTAESAGASRSAQTPPSPRLDQGGEQPCPSPEIPDRDPNPPEPSEDLGPWDDSDDLMEREKDLDDYAKSRRRWRLDPDVDL